LKPVKHLIVRIANNRLALLIVCATFTLSLIYNYVVPFNALLATTGVRGLDCGQMTWNLWFANEAITHGHSPYVTDLIYYPVGANLSHHTLAAGLFPITFLVKLSSGGSAMYPIYSYRIVTLVCFTFLLYFSVLALREFGFDGWSALIPAVGYAFCSFYREHVLHLNHIAGFFIPLSAFLLARLYKKPTTANVLAFSVAAGYAIYCTEFSLYIYIASALFGLALIVIAKERHVLKQRFATLGVNRALLAAGVFALVVAPFLHYWFTDYAAAPTPEQSSIYSANLFAFLVPDPHRTPLYGNLFSALNGKVSSGIGGFEAFIGFSLLGLALLGLITSRQRRVRISAGIALVFFVLSLGPTLKVLDHDTQVPLPYRVIGSVPPFSAGRTPVRFTVIAMFFLMIVAAAGVQWLGQRLSARLGGAASFAIMLLLFAWTTAESVTPIPRQAPFVPPAGMEKVVGPVLNLPPTINDGFAALLQVFHHQPIATGYLARLTEAQAQHLEHLKTLFNRGGPGFCDETARMGYRNVIVTPDAPPSLSLSRTLANCDLNVVDLRRETTTDLAFPNYLPDAGKNEPAQSP
jgi:hypothetical protein